MYSHKRSFTGQSTRSLSTLIDLPLIIVGSIFTGLFSLTHSISTFYKLESHIRAWPDALTKIPQTTLAAAIKQNAAMADLNLIVSTWIGMLIPLILIAIAVRWTLGSLRVAVQRSVTLCYLLAFYFCSFMTVALHNPEWTPGNVLVNLLQPLGEGFFESLRAILCISLAGSCLFTLGRNATSKFNRAIRMTAAGLCFVALLSFDYLKSKKTRSVHESFLKAPSSVKFLFILPGLTPADVPNALSDGKLSALKEQLTSFQEVHPSTPSLLGQFVTSFLGIDPVSHGIRHDFSDDEIVANVRQSLMAKALPINSDVYASAIGGPTPMASLFDDAVPGSRCAQSLKQLARLGHFQASAIPYSLLPRLIEWYFHPELACSNRFLTLDQHLFQAYHQIVSRLHEPGSKTFLIWVSNSIKYTKESEGIKDLEKWTNSSHLAHNLLLNHLAFLESTKLEKNHQTFVVGLADSHASTTAFVRFDGQTKSSLTDLTLESPGQRSQSSVAELLRGQPVQNEKDSPYFYSEFNAQNEVNPISELSPSIITTGKNQSPNIKLAVSHTALRKAIVSAKRHVICQNVSSTSGKRLFVKVSLNLRATENRLPQLTYEDIEKSNLPPKNDSMNLDECIENARERLIQSVFEDVSLRDSSAFKTLLTGLPVKSIRAQGGSVEQNTESEEALDQSTSALPAVPSEEQEQ